MVQVQNLSMLILKEDQQNNIEKDIMLHQGLSASDATSFIFRWRDDDAKVYIEKVWLHVGNSLDSNHHNLYVDARYAWGSAVRIG